MSAYRNLTRLLHIGLGEHIILPRGKSSQEIGGTDTSLLMAASPIKIA